MTYKRWAMSVVGFVLITAVLAFLLAHPQVFFTLATAIGIVLTTDKLLNSYKDSRRKMREKRVTYALLLIIIWLSLAALMALSVTELTETVATIEGTDDLTLQVGKATEKFPQVIQDRFFRPRYIQYVRTTTVDMLRDFLRETRFLVFSLPAVLPLMFLLYYVLSKATLNASLYLVPRKCHEGYLNTLLATREQLYNFITAKGLESVMVGTLCAVGFFIAQLPGWFMLAVIAGALNAVPYVGPLLGAIPVLLIALITGSFEQIVIVLVTIGGAQLLDNIYIQPVFISKRISMNPFIAIGITLLGSHFYGALGLFFSIPVYLTYNTLLKQWHLATYHAYERHRQETPDFNQYF